MIIQEEFSEFILSIKSKNYLKTIIILIILVGIAPWFIRCTSENGSDNDILDSQPT
jgi:hypothetical protein